jgi:UDP-N-acetylmuramoylalanine--D-glutamate ligase
MAPYAGQRVTILGLGLFSGGVSTARFFASGGARVTVTDLKPAGALQASIAALEGLPIRYVLGEHRAEDLLSADLVVVGPAVPDTSPYLRLARERGIPVTTEMNLVFERCRAPIIGVTGSNGKTTTTSLVGALCRAHDARAVVGGNIGRSVLNEIDATPPDTTVVLELSSFQLHRLAWIGRSPHMAVVTNLSPNHLDWHGTYEAYEAAKQQIVRYQTANDLAILNADDPRLCAWAPLCAGRVLWFSAESTVEAGGCIRDGRIVFRDGDRERVVCPVEAILIPGPHNRANVLAAVTAAAGHGLPLALIPPVIAGFRGVAHRLERVAERDGVRYYNDSASTTPESTIIALRAFDAPIILIAGGYDKGMSFDTLAGEAARRAKAVVLIGKTAEAIEEAIRKQPDGARLMVVRASSMEDAVDRCRALAAPGDVAVLSPGCASYDMFINFEDRGNQFKAAVERLTDG